jgi:hypothetical protein
MIYWHFYNYRWANNIPLRDAQPALLTNWFEVTITCDQQNIFQNTWICVRCVTNDYVTELAASGRARWKTENENYNVLKNKGYHLEHKKMYILLALSPYLRICFYQIKSQN